MITTKSQFFYGHTISNGAGGGLGNFRLDFKEGAGPELTAELDNGDYTLSEFVQEVQRALNQEGALTYTVSVNRTTRKITIAASGTFSLLTDTGSHEGTSVWELLGFTTTSDHIGAATYTAENASGEVFIPQAILKDYLGREDNLEKNDAVVNESAAGLVQVVTFGDLRYFMFEIRPITNLKFNSCSDMDYDASAVENIRAFMEYAITKSKMEFMPDRDTPSTYYKVLLESTEKSKQGTAYELQIFAKDVYESGKIKLRELTL